MIFRTDIKEIQRGDKRINSGEYNEGVRKLNALGNFSFNAEDYELVRWTGSQWMIIPRKRARTFQSHFNLFEVTSTSFSIFAGTSRIFSVQVAGAPKTVLEGDFTFVSQDKKWTSGTVSDDSFDFVFLTLNRTLDPIFASINGDSSLPSSDEDTEIMPLWNIPFSGGKIQFADIVDMRHGYHLPAMA